MAIHIPMTHKNILHDTYSLTYFPLVNKGILDSAKFGNCRIAVLSAWGQQGYKLFIFLVINPAKGRGVMNSTPNINRVMHLIGTGGGSYPRPDMSQNMTNYSEIKRPGAQEKKCAHRRSKVLYTGDLLGRRVKVRCCLRCGNYFEIPLLRSGKK